MKGLAVGKKSRGTTAVAVQDHPVSFELRIEGRGFRKQGLPSAGLPAAEACDPA